MRTNKWFIAPPNRAEYNKVSAIRPAHRMSLLWHVNRLSSMSPPEVLHRVKEQAKRATAKRRLEGWGLYRSPGPAPALPGLRARLAGADEALRMKVAAQAAAILSGEFAALGSKWPQRSPNNLFPPEVWRLDPVTGGQWPGPEHYCFDISYRHERQLGDIKYVWEANRLQFLQPLAAHAFFTGDERALAAIEACIASCTRSIRRFVAWPGLRASSLRYAPSACSLQQLLLARSSPQMRLPRAEPFWLLPRYG